MNTLRTAWITLTLIGALATAAGSAQAGPWAAPTAHVDQRVMVHGGGHGWGGHGWGQRGGYRGGYGNWVAPLVGAAIVGSAIYATLPPAPVVVQQPVYPAQPAVITDPSRVSYYCQPYQQYYPHVTQCPSPWQIVPY